MLTAPASPRAGTKRIAPRRWIASRIGMLWIETTPKAAFTPTSSRYATMRSPTVMSSRHRSHGAVELHPEPGAHVRPVVPDRLVLRAAVVPERDRVRAPAETAGPLVAVAVLVQELEDRLALVARKLVDVRGEVGVDVDRLPARDRVAHDHRVHAHRRAGTEHAGAVVRGAQAGEVLLHPVRERVVRGVHAREAGVA